MPKVAMETHVPVRCSLAQTLPLILSQEHHSHRYPDEVNFTVWFSHGDKVFDEILVETLIIPDWNKMESNHLFLESEIVSRYGTGD